MRFLLYGAFDQSGIVLMRNKIYGGRSRDLIAAIFALSWLQRYDKVYIAFLS